MTDIYILWMDDIRHNHVVGVFDSLDKAKAIAEMDEYKLFTGISIKWDDQPESLTWTYGDDWYSYYIRKAEMNKPINAIP